MGSQQQAVASHVHSVTGVNSVGLLTV